MPRRFTSKFVGTDSILEAIMDAEPDDTYVSSAAMNLPKTFYRSVGSVVWQGARGYLVTVAVENVIFMEGNQWNFGHARALYDGIMNDTNATLDAPAGRVYRIKASDVKTSEKYDKENELEYQMSMETPWKRSDIGEYWVQLLDGNHRAAAAMLAGDSAICVYVGENYRANVYKKDFV